MSRCRDIYTRSLFEKESNLKIIRLTKDDVLDNTDNLKLLTEQIIKHETMYPNIESWFNSKVLPGLKNSTRVAYLGLNNDIPFVSAILKCGAYSKFCHLHIDEEVRDHNIGDLFFTIMTLDAKRKAKELHFTLPEGLWEDKKGFFQSWLNNCSICSLLIPRVSLNPIIKDSAILACPSKVSCSDSASFLVKIALDDKQDYSINHPVYLVNPVQKNNS